MLLLKIDPDSREAVYRQIARQVIELVESDSLGEGEILPPSRELARSLAVSRFTVTQAYRELWAKGYVDARPGSYTRVRRRPKLARTQGGGEAPRPGLELRYSSGARALFDAGPIAAFPVGREGGEGLVDFTSLSLDPRLFPVEELKACFSRALTRRNASLLNYADPAGYGPLREYVASRMRAHSVAAEPEEILITHGSLQGLELAASLFVDPGRTVAIEQPTFSSVMPLLLLRGARLGLVPMRPDGMDLDALEGLMERRSGRPDEVSLVYSIPTFHNPTGATSPQPHRERLLGLCERFRAALAEDSFQEEITYFGKAVLPIKSMDSRGIVLYLGSFSKVLFPGVRIGWIVADRDRVERLALVKRSQDISCSPLMQAALHRLCESGAYEQHLRRVNREYARRMAVATEALRRHLPPGRADFEAPSGGYLFWIALRDIDIGPAALQRALRAQGVAAADGGLFYASPPAERHIRLSISSLDEAEIEEGARRLGAALRSL